MNNGDLIIRKNINKLGSKRENNSVKKGKIPKIYIRKQNMLLILLIFLNRLINLNFCVTSKTNRKIKNRMLYSSNEITIKIRGGGTQNILYSNYHNLPTEIFVNRQNISLESENKISNLNEGDNVIIMKWDYKIVDCGDMFNSLSNLIEVDLSNFDTSELTRINGMFYECTNLTSVNLANLYTPKLEDMGMVFYYYQSLLFVDLSSLDTTSVINMGSMFFNCISLKSINFGSNFKTSNVSSFSFTFYSCISLESIDLSSFDTSSVTSMYNMFAECTSLTSIDLSNFRTNSIKFAPQMFEGCSNLKYLDISNFNTSNVIQMYSFFKNCTNLEYIKLNNFVEGNDIVITEMFEGVPDNITYCTNNIGNMPKIKGELDIKNCTINDCSDDWNTKTKKSIEDKNICVYDCSEDDTYIHQYKNKCYNNCPEGTILSSDNKKCIVVCPENLPFEKNEECFAECTSQDFFNQLCIINNNTIQSNEKMVDIIENSIKDESFNLLLEEIVNNGNDLMIKDINEILQITTSRNQINKVYNNNESIIDLGECENLLKEQIGLNDDEALIIFKVDYFLNDLLIPIIEYEIYNPKTKEKIDLNKCSETRRN